MVSLLFAALLAVSFGLLVYPMVVIQPFRHQGETELQAALSIIRWRPYFEALAAAGAICVLFWYFRRQARIWPRVSASLTALLVFSAAALTRLNVYEMMFHPYDRPAFSRAVESKLDGDEKVIAITLNGQARAYPIRGMSYHHIVNDEVGGIPVVATY